jgi:hypothetical protein
MQRRDPVHFLSPRGLKIPETKIFKVGPLCKHNTLIDLVKSRRRRPYSVAQITVLRPSTGLVGTTRPTIYPRLQDFLAHQPRADLFCTEIISYYVIYMFALLC